MSEAKSGHFVRRDGGHGARAPAAAEARRRPARGASGFLSGKQPESVGQFPDGFAFPRESWFRFHMWCPVC